MKRIRTKLSFWLVKLALKLYPESKEAVEFYQRVMLDSLICGNSFVRFDPKSVYCDEDEN